MLRNFYIADDLSELEHVSQSLVQAGLAEEQVHVLSEADEEAAKRRVNAVNSLSKSDIIRSGLIGAGIGAVLAILILLTGLFFDADGVDGWLPFVFLAVVVFGFCTWEGGFRGIQVRNAEFRRFDNMLKLGKHVLIVDIDPAEENKVKKVLGGDGTQLQAAGQEETPRAWVISSQKNINDLVKTLP